LPAECAGGEFANPIAPAIGDALVFDHTDRDLPRALWKPPAGADGYNPDSIRKLHWPPRRMATDRGAWRPTDALWNPTAALMPAICQLQKSSLTCFSLIQLRSIWSSGMPNKVSDGSITANPQ